MALCMGVRPRSLHRADRLQTTRGIRSTARSKHSIDPPAGSGASAVGLVDTADEQIADMSATGGPDLDLRGLELAPGALDELLAFDDGAVTAELTQLRAFLAQFGEGIPSEFRAELTHVADEVTASVRDHQDKQAGRRFLGADSTR